MGSNELCEPSESIDSSPEKTEIKIEAKKTTKFSGIRKDMKTIIFLIYLYFLQGIPLGLAASIPYILSARKMSYGDQGTFSFALWPFSFKLLWAPIVDWVFVRKIGRRKSWLIPIQLLIGVFMIGLAKISQKLIYNIETKYDIIIFTAIFFGLIVLAATQDIALDAWAISMLSKENVSLQGVCNNCGQSAGVFLTNLTFIIFESADFCNKYIRPMFNLPRQEVGLVSLELFMYGSGVLFLVSAIVIVFKKEKDYLEDSQYESKLGFIQSYKVVWKLLSSRSIQKFIIVFVTFRIGLACESVANLKMIEYGVSREKLRLITLPIAPFSIILPLVLSRLVSKNSLMKAIYLLPVKIIIGLAITLLVYYTPQLKDVLTNDYTIKYYLACMGLFFIQTVTETGLFTFLMAFTASITDPFIGGTYFTFLASIHNIANVVPQTTALYLINSLTRKSCLKDELKITNATNASLYSFSDNKCSSTIIMKECAEMGGQCITEFDSYYCIQIGFSIFGFLWLVIFRKLYMNIASLPIAKWSIRR